MALIHRTICRVHFCLLVVSVQLFVERHHHTIQYTVYCVLCVCVCVSVYRCMRTTTRFAIASAFVYFVAMPVDKHEQSDSVSVHRPPSLRATVPFHINLRGTSLRELVRCVTSNRGDVTAAPSVVNCVFQSKILHTCSVTLCRFQFFDLFGRDAFSFRELQNTIEL